MAKYYNRLDGDAREWAQKNGHATAERCIMVRGRKPMGKSEVETVAGNAGFGFTTRRWKKDDDDGSKMTVGLDGQFKKKRGTVARHRKATCRTWTKEQIARAQMDDVDIAEENQVRAKRLAIQRDGERKAKQEARKEKRNPGSRRGHKKCQTS